VSEGKQFPNFREILLFSSQGQVSLKLGDQSSIIIQNVSNIYPAPEGRDIREYVDPQPPVSQQDGVETLSGTRRVSIQFDTES